MKNKNKMHPFLFYGILIVAIIFLSAITEFLQFQVTYYSVNSSNNTLESILLITKSLFNLEGLKIILSESINNFINFKPLYIVSISLLTIGLLVKSGLIEIYAKKISNKIPLPIFVFISVFLGIIFNMIPEVGYGLVMPISALLYKEKKINPIVGILTVFSGLSLGANMNLFATNVDVGLTTLSTLSANVINEAYIVSNLANNYILIFGSVITSIVITILTINFIIPKLGVYKNEEILEFENPEESRNFLFTGIIFGFLLFIVFYGIIPSLPGAGYLLDVNAEGYIKQLLGTSSVFKSSGLIIFSLILGIVGVIYGYLNKKFNNSTDIANAMQKEMNIIPYVILISFFASQLIAIISITEIDTIIVSTLLNITKSSGFSGLPLIFIIFIVVGISNLFIPATFSKWTLMSPVIIPLLMSSGISPEYGQLLYRIAESITNGLTPLYPFMILLIVYIYKYQDKSVSFWSSLKLLVPYTVTYTVTWIIIILSFYIIGLPIGM